VYFNVNLKLLTKLIKIVHLLVCELGRFQNARATLKSKFFSLHLFHLLIVGV